MAQAKTTEPPVETSQKFFRYFQEEIITLQNHVDAISSTSLAGGERLDATEHAHSSITALSLAVQDASVYIPAYDQRTYAQAIKALQDRLDKTRQPRQKFAFRSSRKSLGVSLDGENKSRAYEETDGEEDNHDKVDIDEAISRPLFAGETSINISNQRRAHVVVLPSSASQATTATLSNLEQCVVDMPALSAENPLAAVTLKNLRESLVVCGNVEGSTHATALTDCVIVVACRQFRMHECRNCDVYLQVTGRPIVEAVQGVRFAPLAKPSNSSAQSENVWNQVDDFKWLKNEPSPNWSILPETERMSGKIWEVSDFGESKSLEDILCVVGIGWKK